APGVSDGAEGRGDRAGHGDRAGGAAPGTGPVAVEPGHRSGGRRTARGLARTSASSDARNDYLWLDRRDVFRVNEGVSAGEERRGSGGDAGAERVGRGRSPKECEDEPGEERVAGAHGEASVEARRASRPNPGRVGRDGALGVEGDHADLRAELQECGRGLDRIRRSGDIAAEEPAGLVDVGDEEVATGGGRELERGDGAIGDEERPPLAGVAADPGIEVVRQPAADATAARDPGGLRPVDLLEGRGQEALALLLGQDWAAWVE